MVGLVVDLATAGAVVGAAAATGCVVGALAAVGALGVVVASAIKRMAGAAIIYLRLMPASFASASALSVFSQEKPPSFSGARPKWP